MKQNNFFKKTLLLLAMAAGVSTAWADPTPVVIPQDLGNYVNWETNATKTAGNGSPQSDKTQLGSTNSSTTYTITINNSTVQDYIMQFASGAQNLTAEVSFTLTDGGSYTKAFNFNISNTGSWTPTEMHYAEFKDVPATTLTLTFKVEDTTGSYAGNYGMLAFHAHSTYNQWPLESSSTYLDLSSGTATTSSSPRYIANTPPTPPEIGYIKNGYSIDNYFVYNTNPTNYYRLCMNTSVSNGGGQIKITITDALTGNNEIEQTFDATTSGDQVYNMTGSITPGLKKIRFDFIKDGDSENFFLNFRNVTFTTYNSLPLMGTAYLDLTTGSHGLSDGARYNKKPQYESGNNNVGYNGDGGYSEFIVANSNETAYYDLHIGTSRYQDDAAFTITITDIATDNVEVTESSLAVPSGSSYADARYTLSAAITPGVKKIRIATSSATNTYVWNYKNVTFYKRSLNEGYDYTPVAATGVDVVLTRSITADKWSTICLPFAISKTNLATALGTSVILAGITGYNSTTKEITTASLDAISANVPCFIKVSDDVSGEKEINGVTIATGTPEKVISGSFKLVGTYTPGKIASGDYFFSNNRLYKSTGNSNIKPFRAYFTSVPAGARIMFFDDETTGIADVRGKMSDGRCEYYDLQGRQVAQPTKGLYIVNGKKVIIK